MVVLANYFLPRFFLFLSRLTYNIYLGYITITMHLYIFWTTFYGFYIFINGSTADELINPKSPDWFKMIDEFIIILISFYTVPYFIFKRGHEILDCIISMFAFMSIMMIVIHSLRNEQIEIQTLKNIIYLIPIICWLFYLNDHKLLIKFAHTLCLYTSVALLASIIQHVVITQVNNFGYELPYNGARLLGAFSNPNTTGFCAISNIALLFLIRKKMNHFIYLACNLISIIALIMTLSVSALIQALILCFTMLHSTKSLLIVPAIISILVLVFLVLYLGSNDFYEKINAIVFSGDTVTARISAYDAYLSQIDDPGKFLLGISSQQGIYYSDSAFLNIMHDFGFIVMIPLLCLFGIVLYQSYIKLIQLNSLYFSRSIWLFGLYYFIGVLFSSLIQYQILIMPSELFISLIAYILYADKTLESSHQQTLVFQES
jgi:hypothetical protein